MRINIFNRLNQFDRNLYNISEIDSNIYETISKELKKQPEQLIIFQGNKIIERQRTFNSLQLDLEAQLSYYDGYELDGILKDQFKLKQQNSLDSFQTSSQKDITQSNQAYQERFDLIITRKEQLQAELDKLNQLLERISNSSPQLFSTSENLDSTKQIKPNCQFCQNIIEGREFQTPCFHNFHYECLEVLIKTQICAKRINFQCSCNKKIHLNSLISIFKDYDTANSKKQEFLKNQLLQIQESLKEKTSAMFCSNNCGCMYIRSSNSKNQQKCFCQFCKTETLFIF